MRILTSSVSGVLILIAFHAQSQSDSLQATSKHQQPTHNRWFSAVKVPAILVGTGLLLSVDNHLLDRHDVKEFRDHHFSDFHTKADDYLAFAPAAVVYGLNFVKIPGKNRFIERSVLLAKSGVLASVVVLSLKETTGVLRPDGTARNSFPSGHTATVFVAATFLDKEYRDKSVWYPIGGYALASAVGAMRVLNNRHWISDVLAGAGIGMLSTNIVYLTHRFRWSKKHPMAFVPSYQRGTMSFYMSCRL
jgi:membrane-associated phospholipid phosphatase